VLSEHYTVVVASPKGGVTFPDPDSVEGWVSQRKEASSIDFYQTKKAVWENTVPVRTLAGRSGDFIAVFVAGGHGPMFDLATDADVQALLAEFYDSGKPVTAVCAGVSALTGVVLADGSSILAGKTVTGLSKAELATLPGFTEVMPFLLEDRLRERSGAYVTADEVWGPKVVVDGRLITGENPASAKGAAEALVKLLAETS